MIFSKYQNGKALSRLDSNKWRFIKFSNVLENETSKAMKIKTKDYLDTGEFPIIDQGKKYIAGYASSKEGIYEKTPVIIFGDHTRVIKYVDFPIFIGADGVKLLTNKYPEDEILTKYLYYYLCSVNIPDTGYNRHFKYLKDIVFPIPSTDTQKRIVTVLEKSQELIEKRKTQIEEIHQLTQSVFLKMFGDPITNSKSWPTVTLKDLINKIDKINLKQSEEIINYIDIASIDNEKNEITSYSEYLGKNAPSRAKQIVNKGDILISTVRPNLKNIAMVEKDLENLICSTGFCVLRCNEALNKDFIFQLVKTDQFTRNLVKLTTGANYPAVKNLDILNKNIIYPPLELQNKFSSIVREIYHQKYNFENSLYKQEDLFNSLMQRSFKGELFSDEKDSNY